MMWRWDQGRLKYFQFDTLREIAKVLVKFDHLNLGSIEDKFRQNIMADTGMPFAPDRKDYPIKRNYKRVFQCAFLATFPTKGPQENTLFITDFCRDLASDNGLIKNVDDYFLRYIPKFSFPFPAFDGYNPNETRTYPFCAILKFLIARQELGLESKISLDEVARYIVANKCTGKEDLDFYKNLTPNDCDEDLRQVREMLIFFSQLSILKYYNKHLYLEPLSKSIKKDLLHTVLVPENRDPASDALDEFMQMTRLDSKSVTPEIEAFTDAPLDLEFIEGDRKKVEHFRIERSSLLRKYYRDKNPEAKCQLCQKDMRGVYPWTDYMLEIHHLLPLASTIKISTSGTSLDDVVGLCPSCHKAIHIYYRNWLKEHNKSDFSTKEEAKEIFSSALSAIKNA